MKAPEVYGAGLVWSNRGGELRLDIPPHSDRPLDVFSVVAYLPNQGQLPMTLAIGPVQPANASHQLAPGGWRVQLEISADNASPSTAYLAFRFDGSWPAHDFWRAVAVEEPHSLPPPQPPTPALRDPAEMLAEAVAADEAVEGEVDDN